MPQDGIVNSFVVENPETKQITDMVSYYTLPSSVMHHQTHKSLRAAYSFYNVSSATPWLDLMQDALISARNVRTALPIVPRPIAPPIRCGLR